MEIPFLVKRHCCLLDGVIAVLVDKAGAKLVLRDEVELAFTGTGVDPDAAHFAKTLRGRDILLLTPERIALSRLEACSPVLVLLENLLLEVAGDVSFGDPGSSVRDLHDLPAFRQ